MRINTITQTIFTGNTNINLFDKYNKPIPQEKLQLRGACAQFADTFDLDVNATKAPYFTFPMRTQTPYRINLLKNVPQLNRTISAYVPVLIHKNATQKSGEDEILKGIYRAYTNLTQKIVKESIEANPQATQKLPSHRININIFNSAGNPIPQDELYNIDEYKQLANIFGVSINVNKNKYSTTGMRMQTPYTIEVSKTLPGIGEIISSEPIGINKNMLQRNLEAEIRQGIYTAYTKLTEKIVDAILKLKK